MAFEVHSGTVIAGFRVESLLGQGAMGTVYLAEETNTGRRVALKLLSPELASDERFRRRFLQETELAASLEHPHVVPTLASGEEEGTLFVPSERRLASRKRWIAFFHRPRGTIYVDEGAKKALREQGKSLLPPGITRSEGDFHPGDVVSVCDLNGTEFARGMADVASESIRLKQISRQEVIHRDNLVIL